MFRSLINALLPSAILTAAMFGGEAPAAGFPGPPSAGAPGEIPAPAQGAWPRMTVHQGRYFSFAAPQGWTTNETTNGVDVQSPDGREGFNFAGLEGSPGSSTPKLQVEKVGQAGHLRDLHLRQLHIRPTQHGFETAEFLISFTNPKGERCEGWAWCAVNNSFGHNNFYIAIAAAATDLWQRDSQFLTAAARLINVTNPRQAFQRDQLIRLRISVGPGSAGGFNHPNTFTPYSNQAAMDRIHARNDRARRDDYPLVDPSTGRTYHGTSANYDYVRGGWVNPYDTTQLLQVVPPGQ